LTSSRALAKYLREDVLESIGLKGLMKGQMLENNGFTSEWAGYFQDALVIFEVQPEDC
jgi:hypothetical protein